MEGRIIQFVSGGQTTSFQYDGMGHRVAKTASTGTTIYVYDAFDHLAAEYNAQSSAPLCTTCYLTADWLWSTRVVTDGSSGTIVAQHDYEPFGEELLSTAGRQSAGVSRRLLYRWRHQLDPVEGRGGSSALGAEGSEQDIFRTSANDRRAGN
jgi:YD repeat-containing protein